MGCISIVIGFMRVSGELMVILVILRLTGGVIMIVMIGGSDFVVVNFLIDFDSFVTVVLYGDYDWWLGLVLGSHDY